MAKAKPAPIAAEPLTVSGVWLLKACLLAIAAAVLCAYASLCLLFYQGQWQLLLHPSRRVAETPAALELPFEDIRFDVTETGVPQLAGWWIPAAPASRWSHAAILYLHDGAGSLSDSLPALAALHPLGINVFAFDYRGFGQSATIHPGEASINADAAAAWRWLIQNRHIAPEAIVVYGAGLGAAPATAVAAAEAPAGLVLDQPSESGHTLLRLDPRSRFLPLWLLQNQRFDPDFQLRTLGIPKLFLDRDNQRPRTLQLFEDSASPRAYFALHNPGAYAQSLSQFMDHVLH